MLKIRKVLERWKQVVNDMDHSIGSRKVRKDDSCVEDIAGDSEKVGAVVHVEDDLSHHWCSRVGPFSKVEDST